MDLMGTVAWVGYLVLYHIFGLGEGVYGSDGSGIGFHGFPLKFGEEANNLLPETVAWGRLFSAIPHLWVGRRGIWI